MPGDTVLKKTDAFQGKRKVKDWWSEVEYEVIRQVVNGMPSYEIKDPSGNLQVAHHNRLFLLAIPRGEVMPLNKSENTDIDMSTRSTLAELTSLEVENDLPRGTNGKVPNPTPHQSHSARMGGWRTVTTSHGGPQDSTI